MKIQLIPKPEQLSNTEFSLLIKKAKAMAGHVIGLKDKTNFFINMILKSLDESCVYCNKPLTLENINLDHKIPFEKAIYRKNKKDSKEIRLQLDQPSNLQIICKRCNQIKSDLSDNQFQAFLDFLSDRPDMKLKLLKRLSRTSFIFRRKGK